ncbi:ENDD1 protein, partial [Irena cyanogastra]|nr:ENDD1 protein [Irena cyanogastra]
MLGLLLLQVLASCLWLGHSEVVKSFANCPQVSKFFYRNTTPNNALEPQNPAWICQRYKNQYHYATLYDRDLHIPVYSAYIYQPGPGNRSKLWFVEPQLINTTYSKDMDTEKSILKQYNITLQQIGQSQAINQDYNKLQGLDRGHLSPSSHQSGNNSKWATFTLTNIVPQNSTLNKGKWKDYENQTMAQNTQGCTSTYVITGAVPGNTYISNKRVNVPSHIWSAACCQTNTTMKTWAAIADNNKNQVQNLTLAQLEARLSQLYGRGQVSLFHSACP